MCILCVVQKWSRRIATMLPWLVIPLIGLWALSQLFPPAFRFEITSSRLACVLVLLVTLFWYEVLMPQLSAWQIRRNDRLKERKRSEAIELQKLRKTATRRCRNCFTAYRDQNPGGGKFMCSYCGHISKRPVLDFPVLSGMENSGIWKNLVSKSGKILNGKAWLDNGLVCGQEWLENSNCGSGPIYRNSIDRQKNSGDLFGDHDNCLTERSYSHGFLFGSQALTRFFFHVTWLCRKLFRVRSSRDDSSVDSKSRAVIDNCGENGVSCQESKAEKARRKAEEKRLARLEKELLEEEERKQREEVAKLVEERRRLRDEKMEAEKEHGKGSSRLKERGGNKESERKCQEKKKEKDRGSSKSNSDAEELEKRANKDRKEQQRTGLECTKPHGAEMGSGFRGATASNHNQGIAGTRYLDRMRGTLLSSSRAFTGGGFFGNSSNATTVSRGNKPNTLVENIQTSTHGKDSGRATANRDNKTSNHPVLVEAQPSTGPKKSWQQLFTRSSAVLPPSSSNVISRPIGKCEAVQSPPFSGHPNPTQSAENPTNFGLSSPFSLPSFSLGSSGSNAVLSEPMLSNMKDSPHQFLPEESEIFEDPCYDPDPISLLGPVSESLDEFQQDLGFLKDTEFKEPFAVKAKAGPSEITKPLPIESPLLRPPVSEERHASSVLFPSFRAQDNPNTMNDAGTWQMWNTPALGQDGLGLVSRPASWVLHPDNFPYQEDRINPMPQRTMASLFKKDEQATFGSLSSQNVPFQNSQNGGKFNAPVPPVPDDPWSSNNLFGQISRPENPILSKPNELAGSNGRVYDNPGAPAANSWDKKDWPVQGSHEDGIGRSTTSGSQVEACTPPRMYSLFGHMIR
ncbi:uncharacterized protein LOC127251119 [Andrographis paniculata]|uniref:uncharacterized protein LOC127251119 n=1 Tax=Andrographis paniculata TaxID=175694 RepID=UPI0021E98D1B|nr:uncharacterized protein LOC127251119 [Andrographis paniculata]XP_051130665.1 uncharacterized protein LOC127251119 [Andrographis paniculata]XP_051130666.1 uncharacterized protein LOC127251119 [Andrographis paniculata]XP_051130667.1 uncharacterized protein LOC127251119 [Andrographis paniculata]